MGHSVSNDHPCFKPADPSRDAIAHDIRKQIDFFYGNANGSIVIVGNERGTPKEFGDFAPTHDTNQIVAHTFKRFNLGQPAWIGLNLFSGSKRRTGRKIQARANLNVVMLCAFGLDFDPIAKGTVLDHAAVCEYIYLMCDKANIPRPHAFGFGCGVWAYWLIIPIQATKAAQNSYRNTRRNLKRIFEEGCRKYNCKIDPLGGASPCSITKVSGSRSDKQGISICHRLEIKYTERIALDGFTNRVENAACQHLAKTRTKYSKVKATNRTVRQFKKLVNRKSSFNRCIKCRAQLVSFLCDSGHKVRPGNHHNFVRICCNVMRYGQKLNDEQLRQSVKAICEKVLTDVECPEKIDEIIESFILRSKRWYETKGAEGDGPKIANENFFQALALIDRFARLILDKFPFADIRGRRSFARWALKNFPILTFIVRFNLLLCVGEKRSRLKERFVQKYPNQTARQVSESILRDFGFALKVENVRKIRQKLRRAQQQGMKTAV